MPPGSGSPPTLREVAAQVGVSVMTVSRALQDDPRVSVRTRARVRAAAQELGYRRNELARSLRLGTPSGMLGLVVTNLANPFYSELALGVETVAAARGMKVVLSNTGDDVDRERQIVHDLADWRVEGMIVVSAATDHSHLDVDGLDDIPTVLAVRPPKGITADCVMIDDFGGASAATSRLLASGYRRLGFLGPPALWTTAERLRGFRTVMAETGIPVDEELVRTGQRDVDAAENAAMELLRLPDPPTALFCANSRNAIGAYRAIRHMSTSMALACFDDFELADMLGIPLTVVTYDPHEIGRQAAELLLSRIADHTRAARQVVLPTTIVDYGRDLTTAS